MHSGGFAEVSFKVSVVVGLKRVIDLDSLNTKTIRKNLYQADFNFKSASEAEVLKLYTTQKTTVFPDCVFLKVSMCPDRGVQKTPMCPNQSYGKQSVWTHQILIFLALLIL